MAGSILAIGAHPDDVVLGLGGAIARLTSAGYTATILTISSGELAGDAALRELEDECAAERLGAEIIFGRLPDGAIPQREAMQLISRAMRELEPSIVFVHDPRDTHQDHITAARATTAACRAHANLLYYEGPSTTVFRPTCTVDVSATWAQKLEAIALHRSQLPSRRLVEWAQATALYRAWPAHPGAPCESFRIKKADLNLFADVPAKSLPVIIDDFQLPRVS